MSFSRKSIVTIALGLSMLQTFQVYGQIERKSGRTSVDVIERKREKSNIQKKAGGGSGRPNVNITDIYSTTIEKKLIKGINKTIKYLRNVSNGLPKKSPARFEMLNRILNLHLEQAVYVAGDEQRRYDKLWIQWDRGGRKGREPRLNNNNSKKHWMSVTRVGQEILKEYPKAKNADQINFNQALSLQFLGKEKSAARAYSNLIKRYPNSPVAGDAFFSLGDYYFDRNDFRNAINNFRQALKYRRSKRYGWALFKLGWSNYNLGRYKDAERFWKKTVSYSNRTKDKRNIKLKEEALRDLVYAFAELRKEDEAIAYFRANQGERFIGQFLTLLANTFSDQGQFARSIKVWKRLQKIIPNTPDAMKAQKEIISLNYELRRMETLWVEIERYIKNYGPKSAWARRVDKKTRLEAAIDTKESLLYYSKLVHKQSQKSGKKAGLAQAKKGYLLYLRFFPKTKEVAEIKFNLADIEYFQKDFRRSGQIYLEIALAGKNKAFIFDKSGKPQANIHKDSAKYMLDSFNRDFEPEFKKLLKQKPNFKKPAKPLSLKAKNFIKACGYYSKWYPGDKKTIKTCDTFITEIYYRTNDKKRALTKLWVMATKYPGSKEGKDAVENLIPIYKEDRKGRIVAVNKLLKIPAYQKGKIGTKLKSLRRADEIAIIEEEKNKGKRGDLWASRAKRYPGDKDADSFWFNAAGDYLDSGNITKAIDSYGVIVKKYPRSKRVQESVLQLGKLYDRRLDFASAANFYISFSQKYPKAKESPAALQRACELQIAIQSSQALKTCMRLARAFPADGKDAVAKMIQNAYRSKKYSEMVQLINNSYIGKFKLSANEQVIAYYKIFSAYGGKGNVALSAARQIARLRGNSSIDGEALRYIGEIAFLQANSAITGFLKIKLSGGTVEGLNASIQKKSQALAQLEQAYNQVLATKDSFYGIAALHQIGFAYEDTAKLLSNPPGIKGAKIEDVKKQLAPLANDALNSAKNFYNQASQLIQKFNVYNTWTPRVNEAIARMQNRPLKFQDLVVTPDFVGSEVPYNVASAVYVGGK